MSRWRWIQAPYLFVRQATICLCFMLFAKLVEKNFIFTKFDERHAQRIQKIFTEKEHSLLQKIDKLEQCIKEADPDLCFVDFHHKYAQKLTTRGLYLFVYRNDSLHYWSGNDVAVPRLFSEDELGKPYVSLGDNTHASGKYASFVRKNNEYIIVGLTLIKKVYIYENKYLKTDFHKEFALPANVKIFSAQVQNSFPITDSDGKYMWSLIFDGTCYYDYQIYIPALSYLFAILIFFWLLDSALSKLRKNIYLPLLAVILTGLRLIMQNNQMPKVFYQLDLFTPVYFGSNLFSSLGELCLWCLFICFFVLEVYRHLKFPETYKCKWRYFSLVGLSFATVILCFIGINLFLEEFVINSSGIFDRWTNPTLLFNALGILGYAIIMAFLAAFYLLLDKTMQLSKIKKHAKFKYAHYILTVFIFALFTAVSINKHSNVKYENKKKLLVSILASPHDFTAEFLLRNISDRVIYDTSYLADVVYRDFYGEPENDYPNVNYYIRRHYFSSSYWNRYRFRTWVCDDTWELEIAGSYLNCRTHFGNVIETMGTKLSRSEFWFIDRPNDVSWYLGWFRVSKPGEAPLQLFIELWPREGSDEVGYPELLLDDRFVAANNLTGYSYARYRNNKRVAQSGEYRYNLTGDIFQNDKNRYHTVYGNKMRHLVYRVDDNNIVVLSSASPKITNLIFNFSYIFILSLIVTSICLIIIYLPEIKRDFNWNFRNKIQYSMISVILVSFAAVSMFTFYYVNNHHLKKNSETVNEKMRAIHSELQYEIPFGKCMEELEEDDIEIIFGWLSYFQRLFFTDINLYNVRGQLIATSLPEIFDRGLLGRQINPNAYIKLVKGNRSSIIENEDIGGLRYLSAYEVLTDHENRVIAFLNIPHFSPQNALTEEIANVIMVLLNFYTLIILLTVILSIAMSNQIMRPLLMLQEKFKNIKLGAKNDPVIYNKRDELGELVNEYNRAIEELAISAARLALSERETAWREMAKQIAHEINNPLTPMKLSIQHLKRAYDNKSERFDHYMENITHSLVEQINTLSDIATEFSNFAKMPAPNNEAVDLIEQIKNVVPLFAIDDNKRAFHTNFNGLERAMIFADKEHISRVFVNLLKNAVQAIPKGRQAAITIDVQRIDDNLCVKITDNGSGIPDEMLDKIFRPNFTTKSSGMGVGLSIVRNIINNAGGTISYTTRKDEGTTFVINVPEM